MLLRPASILRGFAELVAVKPSNESVTSSTTLQDDDDLQFSIGAGETWAVRWVISATCVALGGVKLAVAVPSGGASMVIGRSGGSEAKPASEGAAVTFTDGAAAGILFPVVDALVVNGSTAGTVKLQWAQSTSDGTALVFLAKSFMVARKK